MNRRNPSMQPDSQREAALFQAAAQLAPGARASFLDHACQGDAALRRRLEDLLATHEQPGAAAPARASTMKIEMTAVPDEIIGQKIGRYKILENVGEGGCGVVYVAEQTEPVRRRVALKVIKLGMDTRQVVARFEAERQALAMMDHPNIARVLDAGATDSGRPYFVMELVRGIRITDYCDQNRLSTGERLDLFIRVCNAIQHAHQKGIIHRDIKPSNILVTLHDGVPVPKVIDFGIAKATEGRLTDATVYTQLHQFIGTPAYMSPEQAEMSGLDIDTRSDIYSLGVLLYELLTGRTPFDAKELMSQGIDAMRRAIREQEPVRPSTKVATLQGEEQSTTAARHAVDVPRLISLLRGDLDWVVMKCLEKDRTRRYETANGLALDLRRHLNNEPVAARPPSAGYRFQKLVRRNKLAIFAAGAVTAALLLGLVASAWQAVRATRAKREALQAQADEARQREQANAARGQAEGLVSFMIHDLQPALKDYGRLSLLKQVDEKTVAYFDALPPGLRDANTELAHADAISALASISAATGDKKAAHEHGDQALALYQRLEEQHPEMPEAAAGVLKLEWAYYSNDPRLSSADLDARQQDILRRWRELRAKFPDNRVIKEGWGSALWIRITDAAQRFNKPQEAVQIGLELQNGIRQSMDNDPENKFLPPAYASALEALAIAYAAAGDSVKAVQASQEAETFYDQALKSDPGNMTLLFQSAEAAQWLSYRVASRSLKSSRDAELVARERYRLLTSLDPSNANWRHNFAMSHMMECYYLEQAGQINAAREALKKFDALLRDAQVSQEDQEKLVDNSSELARLAAMAGDKADARAQLATGEARFQARYEKLPAGSFDRLQARIRWLTRKSDVLAATGDWAELEQAADETLAAVGDGLAQRPDDSELLLRRAAAELHRGLGLLNQGKDQEALPDLKKAQEGFHDTPAAINFTGDREAYSQRTKLALAEALAGTGDKEEAKSEAQSLVADVESSLAKQPESWEVRESLARSLVLLAGMQDAAKPDEAATRQSLLDRASGILGSPDAAGRLSTDDQETLARIAFLRAAAGPQEEKQARQ